MSFRSKKQNFYYTYGTYHLVSKEFTFGEKKYRLLKMPYAIVGYTVSPWFEPHVHRERENSEHARKQLALRFSQIFYLWVQFISMCQIDMVWHGCLSHSEHIYLYHIGGCVCIFAMAHASAMSLAMLCARIHVTATQIIWDLVALHFRNYLICICSRCEC